MCLSVCTDFIRNLSNTEYLWFDNFLKYSQKNTHRSGYFCWTTKLSFKLVYKLTTECFQLFQDRVQNRANNIPYTINAHDLIDYWL